LLLGGWGAIQILRRFRHEHEVLRESLHDGAPSPYALQLERTAKILGRPASEVEATVQRWMFEKPQRWIRRFTRQSLIREISDFAESGGKLAVVSDYPASAKLTAVAGLPPIEVVVANGEPGGPSRLKPYPDGYLEAARRLGIAPQACLVIGDRTDADGEAATRAGMAFRLVG
jgi:HAD superfamily hydrolase (TIGR01549 family)